MKQFQIFRYLKRWLPLIVCFFIGMTLLASRVLAKKQTYTASAVIEYANGDAKEGRAPDGSAIDVSEIASAGNMAKVMENLGLSPASYSLDTLCASIRVEPIIEEQAQNVQQALNEEGKEYTEQPTAYIVSCKLDASGSAGFARDILSELLDVYFSDYSNKHINQEQVSNQTRDLIQTDYDYLEMVEQIDAQLNETVNTLHNRYQREQGFRSADTGYSFSDLRDQFKLVLDVDVPRLYALILGSRVTKDRTVLLDKYQNRIAGYGLDGRSAQEDIGDIQRIIETYVEKMRQSGNTDIDANYILGDVYERERETDGEWTSTSRVIQYDALLRNWASAADRWDYAEIDAAYCAYIIGVYEGGGPAGGATAAEVEEEIAGVIGKMNALYDAVADTNSEYNDYLGARNIRTLSSASVAEGFNMSAYMAVIAAFFLAVGCCGAIVLGRLGDILEYIFLRDSATGCMNRVSCDKYIQDRENLILPLGTSCINLQIVNQQELNETLGREETNRVLQTFGRVLRELFESRKNGFVGYNGGGQFWVFFDGLAQDSLAQEVERLEVTLRQTVDAVSVPYQMGAVNAGESAVFYIRGLITGAIKGRRPYQTGPAGLKEAEEA